MSEARVDGLEELAIRTCYESNQLERAEPYARARVERGIESATALAVLGSLEWRRGELEPARDHLRRSLFVEHEGVAFNNLALVEWDLGQTVAALDYAERAAQMLPNEVIIRSNLASLLAQAARPDEATPHAAYAGRLAPGESLGVYMPLAAAYLRTNEPERLRPAIDALNEAIARRPADGYSRGLLSVASGRRDDPATLRQAA